MDYRPNGNGGAVTWRIAATAAWIALWAIVLWWMQGISSKVDRLSDDVAGLKVFITIHGGDPK